MATPAIKLAEALSALHALQKQGIIAIKNNEINKVLKQRLIKSGFLKEVIKGWYVPANPDERPGDSTSWYSCYWEFCSRYVTEKYGHNWIISADQSLQLHSGNHTVPTQLMVKSPVASNFKTDFPYNTSLFHLRSPLPAANLIITVNQMRAYSLPASLVFCSQNIFVQNPTDARTALAMIADSSEVLSILLNGGHSTIAGRLAGAFRNIDRERIADDIVKTMKAAGYDIRETDPFDARLDVELSFRERSPYANRIRLMWNSMRQAVISEFPPAPGVPADKELYLQRVDDMYVTDAYHSLSIESYRVTPELIEKVRRGRWNSKENKEDRQQKDAMAARGYWQAFGAVKASISKVLNGANAGKLADDEHQDWYRELFSPSVLVGIIKPADLAGYRTQQVYISGSKHVPINVTALRDAMPVLFELLAREPEASVRAVLGHFVFVNIHPYIDGNGRMGRFMMNVMLASGGYPWTVIPVQSRNEYMQALEAASVNNNIGPFAAFLGRLVKLTMDGKPAATLVNL